MTWRYNYENAVGKIVENHLNSINSSIMYDPQQPKTFIYNYSHRLTNPDLTLVYVNNEDNRKKLIIGDPGIGHWMTITKIQSLS